MVLGTFANCKVGDLQQVKGKLNQIGYHSILQHHMIPSGMRLVGQGFVLMRDKDPKHSSKLCQLYIKSKDRTACPSNDILACAISRLKSYWNGVGWTWPKSQSWSTHKYSSPVSWDYRIHWLCLCWEIRLLYFDLWPSQKCHSKVMHRKEVTHSNGSYERKSRGRKLADEMGRGKKFPWYTHRLMHRKRVTCELHDSYFRLMTIRHAIPKIE